MKEKIFCKICNSQTDYVADSFGRWHLDRVHGITTKEYYDTYVKSTQEGNCKICENKTKFISLTQGYREACSTMCSAKIKEKIEKSFQTKLERYGDASFNNREKASTTLLKLGVENVSQLQEVKEKKEKKSLIRFGVRNPVQSKEVQEKIKSTLLKNYGRDNVSKITKFQEKKRTTMLERYNVEHYSKSTEYRLEQERLGKWIPENEKSEFSIYHKKVWIETRKHKKSLFAQWDGYCYYSNEVLLTNKTDYNKSLYRTIDHKISIYNGFKNNIPIEVIADISNLCICSREINNKKGVLTEVEFKKLY